MNLESRKCLEALVRSANTKFSAINIFFFIFFFTLQAPEMYSEAYQTSKMERFV